MHLLCFSLVGGKEKGEGGREEMGEEMKEVEWEEREQEEEKRR